MLRNSVGLLCRAPNLKSIVTHDVFNQSPILEDFNLFTSNRRLQECVAKYQPQSDFKTADLEHLTAYGKYGGSASAMTDAFLANANGPQFTPFDRQGRRIDSVTFHESYHRLMRAGMEGSVPSLAYNRPKGHGQVPRCALSYMHYQLEQSTGCPLTMTYAGVPVLQQANTNGFFNDWIAKLTTPQYDDRDCHISLKNSAMCGMSMTEKQGGSDVRSNTTTATPLATGAVAEAPGAPYALNGHKWFTSAPMCDGFLTLAQTSKGLSCFLIPRWLQPGEKNVGLRFQRLKNKLGDKANASSEVEYHNAVGYLVGSVGHGVRTIIDMVNLTRLDCLLGSAALGQAALFHATHHANHRNAFGGRLLEKPLMRNVLSDIALEVEASTALAMRLAHAFECDEQDTFRRIAVAIGKYYVCKRSPSVVYECLECMGGNGYVEDFPLARYFRQSPLNAIWEGSGNVIVLDVFRAMQKDPKTVSALVQEVRSTEHPVMISVLNDCLAELTHADPDIVQGQGRALVETLATLLQASALYHSNKDIAFEEFVASRFGNGIGSTTRRCQLFGTLPHESVNADLITRHIPLFG